MMKAKLIGLLFVALGLIGGFGLARAVTAHKYYGSTCPICSDSESVIAITSESDGPDDPTWRIRSAADGRLIATSVKDYNFTPDCYCERCVNAWCSKAAKPRRQQ